MSAQSSQLLPQSTILWLKNKSVIQGPAMDWTHKVSGFFCFFYYNAVKTADQMLHFKCVFAGLGLMTSVSGFLLPPPFHNGSAL